MQHQKNTTLQKGKFKIQKKSKNLKLKFSSDRWMTNQYNKQLEPSQQLQPNKQLQFIDVQ